MEMLLASLLMIWGNLSTAQPDLTLEQYLQASIDSKNTVVVEQPIDPDKEPNPLHFLLPAIKKDPQPDAPKVKGIYVTSHVAGGKKFESLLKLIDETALNAMVIDVKDDYGYITYRTGNAKLEEMGTSKNHIADIQKLISTLEEHKIYPIARIVVFKDSVYGTANPESSFVNADGTVWKNGRGESFVNPYVKEIWDYNVEVAKEAVKAGFKEIQFDYVRFPEGFEKKADILKYTKDERSRIQVVSEFVNYAKEQLEPLGARVSVDIFGYAASVPAAEGIGQDFESISANVDVISPMIYPSHYSEGWFGAKIPDAAPYVTINGASIDTNKKLEYLDKLKLKPIIRPWIQDFTASWVKGHIKYGKKEIEEQIRALKDNGVEEFLLWNAGNNYTSGVNY